MADQPAGAAYIAKRLAELRELAETHRYDLLVYLLDVAHEEAEARLREALTGPKGN
ncbi:hypothetical protein [Amorphus sp. 3PC139-8]|uniref:hypothetical protein n=1 Tax=Amorphus sp. 3PC139-8 TaxID=2735676 RepID=UPI00345D1B6A